MSGLVAHATPDRRLRRMRLYPAISFRSAASVTHGIDSAAAMAAEVDVFNLPTGKRLLLGRDLGLTFIPDDLHWGFSYL